MLTSSRRSLSYPNPATRADTADVPRDVATIIAALELDVVFSQGTHASRPAAGAGSPAATGGGRLYWETDTATLWYDNGTVWTNITPNTTIANGSVVLAMLAANSVDSSKIVDGSIATADLADASVTAVKIATALFPSQGAGAGTEALRALGTAAGTAAAGFAWTTTHGIGTLSARPAAATGNAGYFYFATDVAGGTMYRSDGSTWTRITRAAEISGDVAQNGTINLPASSPQFSVIANGSGSYDVTFNTAFPSTPLVQPYGYGGTIGLTSVSTTGFHVETQGAANGPFNFRAWIPL